MKTLVIGASGLVGSHVARQLAPLGTVVGTGLTRTDGATVPLDIRDTAAVRQLVEDVRPDVIVLAAAEPHVDRCEREPERTRAINVAGVEHVAAAAGAIAARLVYFSSDDVFDGTNSGSDGRARSDSRWRWPRSPAIASASWARTAAPFRSASRRPSAERYSTSCGRIGCAVLFEE